MYLAGMTKRGRKPKPTNLKLVQGNPGKRKINKKEPRPKIIIPTPPAHLSATAKREWKRVSTELFNLGLLSGVDRAALGAYCQAYSRWVAAENSINALAKKDKVNHGLLITTSNNNTIQNPAVGIANKAMADLIKFAAEFGMTPSARSRIEASPLVEDNKADEFFDD